MAIRHVADLRCWQLGNELRREIIAICEREEASKDSRFCNGFRDAIGSVCRNISEGFTRFESSYIVQFFGYALSSLGETQDYLVECRQRKYATDEEFDRLWDLSEHTKASILKFQRSHRQRLERKRHQAARRRTSPQK